MTMMKVSFAPSMQIMWRSWCVRWPAWTCMFSYTRSCVVVTSHPSSPARGSDRASPPSPPSLPLPGCPSILGPPWEDASPNPNQVTEMFLVWMKTPNHLQTETLSLCTAVQQAVTWMKFRNCELHGITLSTQSFPYIHLYKCALTNTAKITTTTTNYICLLCLSAFPKN